MRNLTNILCLTLAVFVGSEGVSWGADLQKGLDTAKRGDFATALKEWNPLAEKRNVNAQFNLGEMYRREDGFSLDYETAIKWHKPAAEQRFSFSQSNLGFMYANGQGVPRDLIYAYMWANLGASNGNEKGKRLSVVLAKQMNSVQIAKAKDLTRECVRREYKGC